MRKTSTERANSRRERIRKAGGSTLATTIGPEATSALAAIRAAYPDETVKRIIEAALLNYRRIVAARQAAERKGQ